MTNSREKFEAWFYAFYEPKEWHYIDIENSYTAWLAGRESMRDEAAKSCEDKADKIHPEGKRSNQVDRHVADVLDRHAEEIRSIEP